MLRPIQSLVLWERWRHRANDGRPFRRAARADQPVGAAEHQPDRLAMATRKCLNRLLTARSWPRSAPSFACTAYQAAEPDRDTQAAARPGRTEKRI